jgi:hypothetical protein
MGRLPYIDEQARDIAASPDQAWLGLVEVIGRLWAHLPPGLAVAWGLQPRSRRGHWKTGVDAGDAIPGFAVATCQSPRLLVLEGRHRFSEYELRFELEEARGGTTVRAKTFAAFPGLRGAAYRALVIGSRGHRVAVRGMLSRIARSASSSSGQDHGQVP